MNYKLLETLCMAHGVTGDTLEVRNVLKTELKKMGIEAKEHAFGSIYFGNDKNPKTMVLAHLDEVGFQIVKIENNGFLRIMPSGWVFPNRLDHALIYIQTSKGKVTGVVLHEEILKSESLDRFDQLFIDIGANSKAEVEKMGIVVGQYGSFQKEYHDLGNAIVATSVDNRISQYITMDILKENPQFLKDNLFVFHVDEECQGLNAYGIGHTYKPDLAVVLDYCPVHQKKVHGDELCNVNDGPLVMYRGGYYHLHEKVRHYFENKITAHFQKGFISSFTLPGLEPASFEQNAHTVACNVVIPALGYHGEAYTVRKTDIENYRKLLLNILQTPLV